MQKSTARRLLSTSALCCGLLLATASGAFADHNPNHQGPKFKFFGNTAVATDPENSHNQVMKINTAEPPTYGGVGRKLNTQIQFLDNEVEFKSHFVGRSCGGGSPRVVLEIDLNNDGHSDGDAAGNFGPGPFGTGCPPAGIWQYEDLTDTAPRWDVTHLTNCPAPPAPCPPRITLPPGTNPFLVPWDVLKSSVLAYPNHNVCAGQLVDDSGWFPPATGLAYYDLLSIGNRTWNNKKQGHGGGSPFGHCHRQHR